MDGLKETFENEELKEHYLSENEEISENAGKEKEIDETSKKGGLFSKKDKLQKKDKNNLLHKDLEKLTAENAEWQDKFLRLYSEFDNYRKRTQKEKLDIIKNASENLIVSLLPILDDMERAVKYAARQDVDIAAIYEGEQLILQKIKNTLKQKGLTPIVTENAKFDTDFHEAVSMVPAPSEDEKGTILEEVEKGYMLNEKVIRFSKVVIYQ